MIVSGGTSLRRAVAFTAAALVAGCSVPVAVDLDEAEANRVAAALDAKGVAAEKTVEPGADGRFRVEVGRDDAALAALVLTDENLPRERTPRLVDALETDALVPSPIEEHEKLLAGVAGELERTLGGVDGVLSARVHLAVPRPDPLADGASPAPSASVLVRYRGDRAPLSEAEVRRLVAGAVPGLSPERVAVVETPVPARAPVDTLTRLGPFVTTRSSAGKLRAVLAAAAAVNIVLAASVLVLFRRVRRRRVRAAPRGGSTDLGESR